MMGLNVLPPPAPETLQGLYDLLTLLRDPDVARGRVDELKDAVDQLRASTADARAQQDALSAAQVAHEKTLAQKTADHDAKLQAAQAKFDAERLRAENALTAREARLAEMEARVKADGEANASLKADLQRRLTLLQQASAA
jgi:hypothetical protein